MTITLNQSERKLQIAGCQNEHLRILDNSGRFLFDIPINEDHTAYIENVELSQGDEITLQPYTETKVTL